MQQIIFNTRLLKDGHLFCPKQYAKRNAEFKVIVTIPEIEVTESDIELATIKDISQDFLTEKEVDYYLNLD